MDNEDFEGAGIPPDKAMELRGISRRVMLQMSIPFIFLLFILIILSVALEFLKGPSYSGPMPVIIIIIGVFVAFFGAFWDFGAKRYLSDISQHREKVTDEDVVYINKQQLILTLIFFGMAGLYVLSAFLINYFVVS